VSDRDSRWSVLALAGVCGLCCVGFGSLALGGAAVAGGVAGVTVADGAIRSLRGLAVTVLATLLPLAVVALALRYRRS
jgi:hypothetical protein